MSSDAPFTIAVLEVRRPFRSTKRSEGLSPVRRKLPTEKMPSQDKQDSVASAATALKAIPPPKVASVWDLWLLLEKDERGCQDLGPVGSQWVHTVHSTLAVPSGFKECDKAKPIDLNLSDALKPFGTACQAKNKAYLGSEICEKMKLNTLKMCFESQEEANGRH